MRFEERQEPEGREPDAASPQAVPSDPHALLALQRSAGNAAVGRMLSRFYTREGDGTLLWRDNNTYDANVWVHNGWTRWKLIPYRVYERKLPGLVADEVLEVPEKAAKTTRRGKRGGKQKDVTSEPLEQQEAETEVEEPAEVAEEPTEAAGAHEQPPAVLDDDGGDWTEVKSAGAVKAEREMNRDVDALAETIDAHVGAAAAIGETFSQFFNARVRQGREPTGTILRSYTTSFDRGRDGYSIEVDIPDLGAWVIHAHLDSKGAFVAGDNAVHYKRRSEVSSLGVSIALTQRQIGMLLPDEATRRGWKTTNEHGTL